jgi:hypothetical protein
MYLPNEKTLREGVGRLWLATTVVVIASCTLDRSPRIGATYETYAQNDASTRQTVDSISTDAARRDEPLIVAVDSQVNIEDAAVADSSADGFDSAVTPEDASTDQHPQGDGAVVVPPVKFGLVCGNVTCPAVRVEVDQCCTSSDDVTAKRAQEAGRCGVDLRGRGGPSCMQVEQQGLVDAKCAAATTPGALAEELGCCSAEGKCGTFNALDGIGCHYNDTPGKSCSDVDTLVKCERTGVFALRTDITVSWGGRTGGIMIGLTESGRSKITVLMLATIDKVDDAGEFASKLKVCYTDLPPFYSELLCEAYHPVFLDPSWDSDKNPEYLAKGRYQCANPGCFLTMDPSTLPLGIELKDPDAPWPTAEEAATFECSRGTGVQCFPDVDGDGLPGITVELLTQGKAPPSQGCTSSGYDNSAPPLTASLFAIFDGVRRADRLFLGVRVRTGGSSLLTETCGFERGTGIADYVQSRAAGCMVQKGTFNFGSEFPVGSNVECNTEETAFMNSNLPTYDVLAAGEKPPQTDLTDNTPSEGSSFETVRLGNIGETFTCKDVREIMLR